VVIAADRYVQGVPIKSIPLQSLVDNSSMV